MIEDDSVCRLRTEGQNQAWRWVSEPSNSEVSFKQENLGVRKVGSPRLTLNPLNRRGQATLPNPETLRLELAHEKFTCSNNNNPTETRANTYITGLMSLRRPTIRYNPT